MPVRIILAADVHVGMKFTRGYESDVREALVEARFEVLDRIVRLASEHRCDLLVIAGDLFDHPRVARRDILRVAESLRQSEGVLTLVLPGNHDYVQGADDPLWSAFCSGMGEGTILLAEPSPRDLREHGIDAVVYPAPCTAKHSSDHALGWVAECPKDEGAQHHIGVAHGSLSGVSPDFEGDYYPMTQADLDAAGVDLWLMGHTHVRYPADPRGSEARILFSGTPEPDGFDCSHAGSAWLIELGDDKTVAFESVATGEYRFLTHTQALSGTADVEHLREWFQARRPDRDLVKLTVTGRVPREIHEARRELDDDFGQQVLHLETDWTGLLLAITEADIDREFMAGSFPHRLLTTLAQEADDPLVLQTAYDLIREAKS